MSTLREALCPTCAEIAAGIAESLQIPVSWYEGHEQAHRVAVPVEIAAAIRTRAALAESGREGTIGIAPVAPSPQPAGEPRRAGKLCPECAETAASKCDELESQWYDAGHHQAAQAANKIAYDLRAAGEQTKAAGRVNPVEGMRKDEDDLLLSAKAIIYRALLAARKLDREKVLAPHAEVNWLRNIQPEMQKWCELAEAGFIGGESEKAFNALSAALAGKGATPE